jgi:ferric-dicitrate binding protein FerR (iron transport regulator)
MMETRDENKIQMMAYLDGEMDSEQRREFETRLMASSELQKELRQFQKLQGLLQRVRVPEPKPELWDEWPRQKPEKYIRLCGWIMLILGALIFLGTGGYLLWADERIHLGMKTGLTLASTGIAVLLAGVIRRRRLECKTDRYKEILR